MTTRRLGAPGTLGTALVAAAVLWACGGGGSGGDPEDIDPLLGTVRITAANQDTVARAAMVVLTGGAAEQTQIALAADRRRALGAGGVTVPAARPVLVAPVRRMLDAAAAAMATAGQARPLTVIGPVTQACSVSGTLSITFDDRDDNRALSAGDVIDAVATACRDVPEVETSGRLTLTVTAAQSTPTLALSVNGHFTNFNVASTSSVRRTVLDGDFTLQMSEPDANTVVVGLVAGSALSIQVTHPKFSDTVTLYPGYSITVEEYLSAPNPAYGGLPMTKTYVSGVIGSRAAGGTLIAFTNIPNFEQVGNDVHPRVGLGQVSTNYGVMHLRALSSSTVRIETDVNSDGVFESKDMSWDDLI